MNAGTPGTAISPAGPGRARVGCSGWMYRDWKGRVYPDGLPQRRWFAHYATLFDTVELDSTFYRLPSEDTVVRWRDAAPPGFVYAMKLGAFGTHRMKLRDAGRWLPNHLARAALLGDTLGPTLVQLPPHWHRDPARLDEFLTAAPATLRWAVEVRDPTWLHDEVYTVLERHGAALCLHDLLPRHPALLTARWTYVRFHGPRAGTEPYAGRYGGARLWRWAERMAAWLADGVDVYAYFNNDIDAHAVADARWLAARLGTGPAAARR